MAEVLIQFDNAVVSDDGRTFTARVCGGPVEDGMWEGWLEFEPATDGTALRTPRETKQPNRADLEYWAGGLTPTYLEGALERAEDPST